MKLIKRVVLWGMLLMIIMAAVPCTALAASDTEMNIQVTGRIGNHDTGDDPGNKTPEEPQTDPSNAGKKSSSTASGVKTSDWTKYSSYLMLLGGAILIMMVYMNKRKKSTIKIHYN